jgi:hypothetical protein
MSMLVVAARFDNDEHLTGRAGPCIVRLVPAMRDPVSRRRIANPKAKVQSSSKRIAAGCPENAVLVSWGKLACIGFIRWSRRLRSF